MLMNRAYFFKYMYVRRKKKFRTKKSQKKSRLAGKSKRKKRNEQFLMSLKRRNILYYRNYYSLDLCITTSVLSWGAFNYLAIDTTFSHGCMGCFVCILISIKSS